MQKTNYLSVNDIEPITNTWDKLMMILQEVSIVLFIVNAHALLYGPEFS